MNWQRLVLVAATVVLAIIVIGLVMARMPHRSQDQRILLEKAKH